MKLPLFLVSKWKYLAGALLFLSAYLMYHFTNYYPYFTPKELHLFPIDHAVPFIPWTVLIYVSEYFFFTLVYLICRDMENLNKYIYSFFTTQALSCLVFFFWPTVYPRELFPIPMGTHPFVDGVWMWLRSIDAPTNCFPSLHVSTVYLSTFIFLDEQKKKFPFFFTWGTLIALSTLTTKQHYFVDIIAGLGLSIVTYWLFHRKVQYERVGPALAFQENSYQANR